MSIETSELGDHWVKEFAKELKSRRDKAFRSHAACKPGGIYGEQMLKAAQAIDRAYQAVIVLPAEEGGKS